MMKKNTIAALVATLTINTVGTVSLLGVWGCTGFNDAYCGPPGSTGCQEAPQSDGGTTTDGGNQQPDADPPKPQTCDERVACPKDQSCQNICVEAACKGAPSINDVWGRETGALGNPPCGCPNALCQDGQAAGRKGQEDPNNCQGRHIRLWQNGDKGDPAKVDRQQKFCLPPGQF